MSGYGPGETPGAGSGAWIVFACAFLALVALCAAVATVAEALR